MMRLLADWVRRGLQARASATGLGLFRIAFGLVIVQEVLFLFYFRHLIFDPVPFFDRASPILHFFLLVWLAVALCLTAGYHTRQVALANYGFWVLFVVFTPMWQDFDGGFDQLMTASSFLLVFLPAERGMSLDNLRLKWRNSTPARRFAPDRQVPVLAYVLPLALSLGLLYLDSGLHKLSSQFWRNGLGAWLPPTMPYYASPWDASWLLNLRGFETAVGYTIIGFQFAFLALLWFRPFRLPLLLLGAALHTGIILCLNVYPFGFAMLVHYVLLVPFRFWTGLGKRLRVAEPLLTVYYDEACPLCNRTVIAVEHFDVRRAIAFRGLQTHARSCRALDAVPDEHLLQDLYAVSREGKLFAGLDTYIRILRALGYAAPLGWLLGLPGVRQIATACYRRIADGRQRLVCDADCTLSAEPPLDLAAERPFAAAWQRFAGSENQQVQRIAKFLVLVLVLQLNSTVHYGLLYRWAREPAADPALAVLDGISNTVINYSHAFLGITPHALYLDDHFAGYEHLLALTYRDATGQEHWLPFINPEGRLLTPNWGRVQSMWANVAITSHLRRERLDKFLRKLTAFWGTELGLNFDEVEFVIKLKRIEVPMTWQPELRHRNMSGTWEDIGTVRWRHGNSQIAIPGVDVERL